MEMHVSVKLDKLCLSSRKSRKEVEYPYDQMPIYSFDKCFNPSAVIKVLAMSDRETKQNASHYNKVAVYRHLRNGNTLLVFHIRGKSHKNASPVYVVFYAGFDQVIDYSDVYEVEKYLMQFCGGRLRVSIVHVAVDISTLEDCDLYEQILCGMKSGKKSVSRKEDHGVYYGSLKSSNTLLMYDKSEDIERELSYKLPHFIVRVEPRLRIPKINSIKISTIDQLADYDWSFLYGSYFSLHEHTRKLDNKLSSIGVDVNQPIWKIKDIMARHFKVTSSNFYRDYLKDHSTYSEPVRDALSRYRWCADYRRYQS